MPKTLLEKIVFTVVMATIMVYGMIVYNVALNTGGVTNATFVMALHEMPIMVPAAFILEFFVVEKLATRLAFSFMQPTDRPQFITYAISLMIVCMMCPVMSLIATVLFKEPSFGTCLVRATDHTAEGLSKFSRNYYSRRQAFNANNTYFITFSGDSWWHLYDAATLKYVRKLSPRVPNPSLDKQYHIGSDSEVVWHPTDPNSLYYLSSGGGTKLMKLDVRNNTYQVVADFKGKLPSWASGVTKVWTRWEGSPSKDARYWGFQMEASGKRLGFFVWDLQQNKLVGSMQSSISSDHTSMSPSGRWIVIADTASGTGTRCWSS